MTPTITLPLPPRLRHRAERFFQADLGGVRLHVGPEPRELGAWAFARGDDIHLEPRLFTLGPDDILEAIGHELAHVLQQRGARSCEPATATDVVADIDPCERQALELGRRFATGRTVPSLNRALLPAPQLPQCLVSIGGQPLRQVDDLTPKTQTLLALIDGAERWLSWAIPAPVSFRFADEASFVAGLQRGLHGDALVLLPRLGVKVHPRKLWTLKDEHLNQLLAFEGDDEDNQVLATSLQSVLQEYGIFGQQSLARGMQFLRQVGKADLPVFQALSLADEIALTDLVNTPPTPLALDRTMQAEAAAFAVESTQTPQEFVEAYAFFFEVAARLRADDSPASASVTVRRLRDALLDPIQALLPCPVVSGVPGPVEMYALVNQWVDQKQLIGFRNVPAALRQVARSGPLPNTGEDSHAFESRLLGYIDGAQQFLKQTEPSARTLSQDGLTHSYSFASKAATARVDRNHDGLVTLGTYQRATSSSNKVVQARQAGGN